MKVAITVEGQRGLTWPKWQRLATAVADLGFSGLYRSDHFLDADPPDQESLALWPSLTWLADHTTHLEFGPLVTPLSFRHPVHTARMARDVDDLSGGRLVLGIGAGWGGGRREHEMFGFDLLDLPGRLARFEEGIQVIQKLLRDEEPVTLDGRYYTLQNATFLPRPTRPGGPPIMIGGNAPKRVLPLAAKYADEWNSIYRNPEQFVRLSQRLDELLVRNGRSSSSVVRSQMKGLVYGRNQTELNQKLNGQSADTLFQRGLIAGTPNQIIDQLHQFAALGLQKVMLQWPDFDDLDALESLATAVLPASRHVRANDPIKNRHKVKGGETRKSEK